MKTPDETPDTERRSELGSLTDLWGAAPRSPQSRILKGCRAPIHDDGPFVRSGQDRLLAGSPPAGQVPPGPGHAGRAGGITARRRAVGHALHGGVPLDQRLRTFSIPG